MAATASRAHPAEGRAASTSAKEPLLIAAAFLDGMVAVSGLPLMVAQGSYVAFPSGTSLAVYQLCYLLPQFFSTFVAEQLTSHFNSLTLLFLSLLCSSGSAAVLSLSLFKRALPLFFLARLLNGVLRHEKMLFALSASALHTPAAHVGSAARFGMMTGMVVAGVAGDVMRDAVQVANFFTAVEMAAGVLVLLRMLQGRCGAVKVSRITHDYVQWLRGLVRFPAAVYQTLMVLVAVMLAASVNQVVYPFVGPAYGFSYSFVGAHLGFNLFLQVILIPYVVKGAMRTVGLWKSNIFFTGSAEKKVGQLAGLALLLGCVVVPAAGSYGPYVFYLVSLFLLDIPAGISTAVATQAVHDAFRSSDGDTAPVPRLLGHVTQLVKLFAAPLRIMVGERFPRHSNTVRYISLPLMVYVVVFGGTRSVASATFTMVLASALLMATAQWPL